MHIRTKLFRRHKKASDTPENTEQMDAMPHDPSSTFVKMQRRVSSISFASCFSGGSGNGRHSISSFRSRRRESKATEAEPEKTKPKYFHTPQYAAEGHTRTTSTIPFAMRPLSADVTIHPVRASAPVPYGMRPLSSEITIEPVRTSAQIMGEERAKYAAGQGGRVHLVGSSQ
ncbi:hypothetical protein H072_9034 [Dactylellina haptotyla CBS 200.50]|uniref:Uncharacterized protein n=1 Tax=Dactylellina haptotyla (strain CBS 200.50) TaxID=1284197 RepID=S8A3J3_DACHA|nr:hypothetical protein H072_9034 [Dactylellina haptotyla CBS 200.50]